MSAPTDEAYVAMRIAELADAGTPASELLASLPDGALFSAIRALADTRGTGNPEGHQIRCATVRRVLQAELDSR